jgi:hypothetical protein
LAGPACLWCLCFHHLWGHSNHLSCSLWMIHVCFLFMLYIKRYSEFRNVSEGYFIKCNNRVSIS